MPKALPRSRNSSRPSPRSVARRKRTAKVRPAARPTLSRQTLRARRKFLAHFPGGVRDETYLDWERGYKWNAHRAWEAALNQPAFENLIRAGKIKEIEETTIRIECRTNLLFSFVRMAHRKPVRSPA